MTGVPSPDAVWRPSSPARGTLALVMGRGERAAVYERFGQRVSADGYTLAVFHSDAQSASAWLATARDVPRVIIGSDSGASAVLHVLAQGADVHGAIVVGVPLDSEDAMPSDSQRTACPSHLRVLSEPQARLPAPPEIEVVPDRADLAAIDVPVLAVHGGADPISPLTEVVTVLDAIPDLDFREAVGGLHDALNDVSHRSVAAAIVLWLERLRQGDARAPIVRRHPLRRIQASGAEDSAVRAEAR